MSKQLEAGGGKMALVSWFLVYRYFGTYTRLDIREVGSAAGHTS